jgi:hypothetical protein
MIFEKDPRSCHEPNFSKTDALVTRGEKSYIVPDLLKKSRFD